MEQFIKIEIGKLRKHQKEHFERLHKKTNLISLIGSIAALVLILLQIYNIIKN